MNMFTAITTVAICISAVTCQMPTGLMGSMGMGMAMGAETMTAADYMILDSIVKHIIGPNAAPSPTMILLAQQQGGLPNTFTKMMPYITLMQNMARKTGMTVPEVTGKPTEAQINNHVMQRAMNWIQQRYTFEAMAEHPAFGASMMGQRGAPNMFGQQGAASMFGQQGVSSMSGGQQTANVGKTAPTGTAGNQAKKPADLFSMMAMGRAMGMEGIF